MTFSEKFQELKEAYLKTTSFENVKEDFAAEITLTDPDCGGTFYIKKTGDRLDVEPYDYRDHTVKISLSSDLFGKILVNEKSAVAAFMDGELDAEGDVTAALALVNAMKKQKRGKRKASPEK